MNLCTSWDSQLPPKTSTTSDPHMYPHNLTGHVCKIGQVGAQDAIVPCQVVGPEVIILCQVAGVLYAVHRRPQMPTYWSCYKYVVCSVMPTY
jgi:hypothetical protein